MFDHAVRTCDDGFAELIAVSTRLAALTSVALVGAALAMLPELVTTRSYSSAFAANAASANQRSTSAAGYVRFGSIRPDSDTPMSPRVRATSACAARRTDAASGAVSVALSATSPLATEFVSPSVRAVASRGFLWR